MYIYGWKMEDSTAGRQTVADVSYKIILAEQGW